MKKLLISLSLCGLIMSCSSEPGPLDGYFKRYYAYGYNNDAQHPFLIRIHGDTIVQYFVVKQLLDSSTYIWSNDKSAYFKLGPDNIKGYSYNRPAFGVGDEKAVLKIDTTGYANCVKQLKSRGSKVPTTFEEILMPQHLSQAQEGSSLSDTLYRLSKAQFLHEVREQKLKDSIAFFHPYISEFFAEEQIRSYISYYLEDRGAFQPHSLEIKRQADNIFHGKFKIKKEGYYTSIDTYIFQFNFDKENMKARRIN